METEMETSIKAKTQLISESVSIMGVYAMNCARELDIPNIIHGHGGSMPLAELAQSIPIPSQNIDMLRRLMRILTNLGVFTQPEEDEYALTAKPPVFKLNDSSDSGLSGFLHIIRNSGPFLSQSLRSEKGLSTIQLANNGKNLWEALHDQSEISKSLYKLLDDQSVMVLEAVIAQYPEAFRGFKSLIDVGGGTGSTSKVITNAFPDITCTVLELPHVVASIQTSDKIKALAGDMFQYIPPANALFLMGVLHELNDADCMKVLERCKEAISSEANGKVIVVERVYSSDSIVSEMQLFYDMIFMSPLGGRERKQHDWEYMFSKAGFTNYTLSPLILGACSIMELYP